MKHLKLLVVKNNYSVGRADSQSLNFAAASSPMAHNTRGTRVCLRFVLLKIEYPSSFITTIYVSRCPIYRSKTCRTSGK